MHKTSFEDLVARFEGEDRQIWQKPEAVIARLGDLSDKAVIDLGAGSGYFTFRMATKAKNVTALDYDARFIEFLEERKERENEVRAKNVKIRLVDESNPALQENAADVVLTVNTYHHFKDRVDYLKKIRAGIKENGRFLIIDFRPGELPFGPPEHIKVQPEIIQKELLQAGFAKTVVDLDLLPHQMLIEAFI